MYIESVKLENFRNYKKQEINLNSGINVIFGDNAQGKTNLLEAIYICSIGKSFRTNKEKELIKFGENKAKLEVNYQKSDRKGKVNLEISDKKKYLINNVTIKKTSEILGKIYVVTFTPDDIEILKNGPSGRRKFLNILISQLRPSYVYILNQYIKTLNQRNIYLKQIKIDNKDENMLDIWDEKLSELAEIIYEYRKEFINKIQEKIQNIHFSITENKESIKIEYVTNVNKKNENIEKLKKNRKKDIKNGITSIGIHRDDFILYINDKEVSIYGSQGQHRTAMLTLKMAELEIIYDEVEEYPILLLDDFMSELDETRRKNLLKKISNHQVIITCTDKIEYEIDEMKTLKVQNGEIQNR